MMRSARILIVDDDKYMTETLAYVLKEEKYKVETANDTRAALEKLRSKQYDLVILDYNLSSLHGKTGLDILKETKEIKPTIKSIMISAYGDGRIKKEADKVGVNEFLDKPFAIKNFINKINKLVINNKKIN